jgi:hypothetical protein
VDVDKLFDVTAFAAGIVVAADCDRGLRRRRWRREWERELEALPREYRARLVGIGRRRGVAVAGGVIVTG